MAGLAHRGNVGQNPAPEPEVDLMKVRALTFLTALSCAVLSLLTGEALASDPSEGDQIWAMAALTTGMGFIHPKMDRVKGYLEFQSRWRSFGESFDTGFFPRLALGYAITDRVTVFAGHAVVEFDPAHKKPYTEQRPWQQLTWNLPVTGFTLQSRTRLEQRIHQQNLGWRARQMVKATVPMPGAERLFLSAYDELFFDLDDTPWGQRRGFRQNRAFAGLGARLDPDKHISVEAGYLNQWIDRRNEDKLNHVLSLNLFLNY